MKINTPKPPIHTHGGAVAQHINPELQLRRSVMACMLWEGEFYESGETIASRIQSLVPQVKAESVRDIAIEARGPGNLRHVPLLLACAMAGLPSHKNLVAETLEAIIQRPDELTEFLAIYWKDGRKPLSAQIKKGLARAFTKFNAYSLAKYNQDNAIKLRDVLFLCHAKPKDDQQAEDWKQLIAGTLPTPDTWEVALSSGANKKESWERLISENKLGGLALLRNLRNMVEAGVDEAKIKKAIANGNYDRVLPFRFIAAAKAAPRMESAIDKAFLSSLSQAPKLEGKTIVIIDVSGSMQAKLSGKSDMTRLHAACALGAIAREVCTDPHIYATAGSDARRIHATAEVPPRRGMALVDATADMMRPLGGGGIFLTQVIKFIREKEQEADRIIVITDEQDCGHPGHDSPLKAEPFGKRNYLINVASARNGIGYGKWTHFDGFSESVIKFIHQLEQQ